MGQLKKTEKLREIINLGASIAAGCQPCTKYHIKKCIEASMSGIEIHEIIDQALQVTAEAFQIMSLKAINYANGSNKKVVEFDLKCETKRDVLVGLVSSYTINNTDIFDFFLKSAYKLGIGDSEISNIMETSKFIYSKAKAHVDILSENKGLISQVYSKQDCSSGCGC